MPEFDSAGVRLHYELAGPDEGPPIVLVHGYASDYALNWVGSRWQSTLAGAGRLVVGLDCRGHGRSQKPHDPAAYDRGTMAGDVVRLLDHLEIQAADYLGYSMGGQIGLVTAIEHPGRLRRAVLGGVGRWSAHERAELIARRMRGDESVDDPAAEMFYRFAAARPVNDLEALACCILGPRQELADRDLARLGVPALLVAGGRDPIARGAESLARLLPHGRFLSLPGRDHMNAMPARPFKEAALAFLDELSP